MYLISFFGLITICFKITTRKGIRRIYKHSQGNWPYSSPNTTFVIPQRPETSTQTQRSSVCDDSMGAHDLESSISDQSNINHINTDINNNDGSLSFEVTQKNCSSLFFGDKKTTTTTPDLSKLTPLIKENICFQTEGKLSRHHNMINQEH